MKFQQIMPWKIRRLLVAVAVIVVAASLRIWPLQALGTSLVWLTFYPAVMVAAIYGGLLAGLVGTALACLIAAFAGPLLVGAAFVARPADWLGMAVFILTGTMISGVAEAMLRANARARKAQQAAEAASNAKSVFLASMSHELRTPLNAILGFSGLLRHEAGISPEQRRTLDLINRSGEHLLSLINDVLDMAKVEAGQLDVDHSPFDLDALTRDVLDLMRVRAEEKGLQVVLDKHTALPRLICGDGAKLRQVLINLIGNAVKFTAEGRITLRLSARPTHAPHGLNLLVEVEDTGSGIAAEDQDRIFEPFTQIVATGQQTLQKGTGLGLSITRQYVEVMGGRISVESQSGRGSCFRIELPVERADELPGSAAPLDHTRVIGLEPGQTDYRILIVEDQIENWLLLRRLLESAGLTARVVENGQLGIEMFQSWHPHFIWMDLRMPVLDGLAAARHIRTMEGGQDVQIAALTASVFKEERDRVMAAGMDDFVSKPFRPAEVFDCLTRHLGIRFVREDEPLDDGAGPIAELRPEALVHVPAGLREALCAALVSLDRERLGQLLRQLGELDPALGHALAQHAERLDYTALLHFLAAPGAPPGASPGAPASCRPNDVAAPQTAGRMPALPASPEPGSP
jgi:signal transduction histidine kinase/CheY-like chemotaxis protein